MNRLGSVSIRFNTPQNFDLLTNSRLRTPDKQNSNQIQFHCNSITINIQKNLLYLRIVVLLGEK